MPFISSSYVPSVKEMILMCEQQHVAVGILLLGLGLVFMIMGVKLFRTLVPLSFAAIGLSIGLHLRMPETWQWSCGIAVAVALALGSSYFSRLGVALLAGGWTAMVASSLAVSMGLQPLISAGVGVVFLAAVASLTLALYSQVIAYVTSLEGALMTVGGVVCIMHSFTIWQSLRTIFVDYPFVAPFFVVSLTVMGFYLQLAETRQLESGMSG